MPNQVLTRSLKPLISDCSPVMEPDRHCSKIRENCGAAVEKVKSAGVVFDG
jgi:hypothetical protein